MSIIRVNGLSDPELQVFSKLNENELKHYFEPEKEGVFIAETPTVVMRALNAGFEPLSFFLEEKYAINDNEIVKRCYYISRDEKRDIPIFAANVSIMSKLTGFNLTRGVLGAFKRKPLPEADKLMSGAGRVAILEHVENPINIGAIFRSAAALNMDAIFLTDGCADPLQRRAIRAGVGTVFQIPWTYISGDNYMDLFKQQEFLTAGMALREDTVSVDDTRLKSAEKLAIILGNEGNGLTEETIQACDYTVKIPMSHGVDSLNVAAASAIAFFCLGGN